MTGRASILIVDDSPDDIDFLNKVLRNNGFSTVAALSGQEALEKIESERPHLALLDVMLPNMSG